MTTIQVLRDSGDQGTRAEQPRSIAVKDKRPTVFGLQLLVAVCCLLSTGSLRAAEEPVDCGNPRSAVDMLFYWQQPGRVDLTRASSCLDANGRKKAELRRIAHRTKSVYDSRGLFVEMQDLSELPDYTDRDGRHRAVVHSELPQVSVARFPDGRWLWTAASIRAVDHAYKSSLGGPIARWVDRLPAGLRERLFGLALWQYLALGALLVLGLVLRKFVRVIVANRVRAVAERLGLTWASTAAQVTAGPLSTAVLALVFGLAYPGLALPVRASEVIATAVRVVLVLSLVWWVYRLVDLLAERMASKASKTDTKLDDQLVPLVRKSLKILVVVSGVLFVLQNLDVDVGSLLTGLGIGGLAFALAAKDSLANFFGSVMIFTDRPFQIGDWIKVKGAEGIVEEVGFRSTRVRTFYNSLISIPNATFTDAQIDNFGRRQYRRTSTTLNLTYSTTPEQMQAFCEGIRAIILANQHTRKDYYEVHFSSFGASSLDVMLYFFLKVPSWTDELRERHNVYLEILRLAKELGVDFAFPTRTLHMEFQRAPGDLPPEPAVLPSQSLAETVLEFGPQGTLKRPEGPNLVPGALVAGSTEDGDGDGDG